MEAHKEDESQEKHIAAIIADIVAGKQSVLEMLGPVADGDYWTAVQQQHLFHRIGNLEVLRILLKELQHELSRRGGLEHSIQKELAFKDGERRFNVLMQRRLEAFNGSASLLTGTSFSDCLSQYLKLIAHMEALWSTACGLFRSATYPLSAFVSILVIEEVGKLAHLAQELVAYDLPSKPSKPVIDRDHR